MSDQTSGLRSSLSDWRTALLDRDRTPWPGPKPLERPDRNGRTDAEFERLQRQLLVGREDDVREFRDNLDQFRLVLLTGGTGIGKTSLLRAGLIPDLEDSGFVVGLCRDWSGALSATQSLAFLSGKIREQFLPDVPALGEGAETFWHLNAELGRRCVIVLDQFEELIRDASQSFVEEIFELIVDVNARTNLKIVISFRSENLLEMLELERRVKAMTMSHITLKPIDTALAVQVIQAPNTAGFTAIADDAAKRIAVVWQEAMGAARTGVGQAGKRDRVGLLNLQAMLYVLAHRAGRRADGSQVTVTMSHVDTLLDEFETNDPGRIFVRALTQAVDTKIAHCDETSGSLDSILRHGVVRVLAQAVPHLSSGGFKLIRDARDLAGSALDDVLEQLGRGLRSASSDAGGPPDGSLSRHARGALLDVMLGLLTTEGAAATSDLDLLLSPGQALAEEADRHHEDTPGFVARLHPGASPRSVDPLDITSGVMRGMAPAAVLIEEFRRFALAMEWLRASDIVRLSTPGDGSAMVALVHDGFGTALDRWAAKTISNPSGDLSALTAAKAADFYWKRDDGLIPELDGEHGAKLIVNMGWRGAWIQADFRNVCFVNCDLRGAGFASCTFEGVSFVNCLLDGVLFTDCEVIGNPEPPPDSWTQKAPTYRIPDEREWARILAHYRGAPDLAVDSIHAPQPGLPALPQNGVHPTALLMRPDRGGMVLHGGRVSALTIRHCTFGAGLLSLRQVAGSGLDFVEQRRGRIEMHACALRHVSLSPPIQASEGAAVDAVAEGDTIMIEAKYSSLVQTWISTGLHGEATLYDCSIVQFFNDSDVRATAQNCSHVDLHGVTTLAGPGGKTCVEIDADNLPKGFAERFLRMDYRRDPSKDVHAHEAAAGSTHSAE